MLKLVKFYFGGKIVRWNSLKNVKSRLIRKDETIR